MSESKSHKVTANRIAKKLNADYNSGKGVDIKSGKATVEVETPATVKDALSQLQGHRGPCYIAGTNQEAAQKAMEATKETTLGVMNNQGKIVKKSTRKK
jgi:sulfur carrier protein ThiS